MALKQKEAIDKLVALVEQQSGEIANLLAKHHDILTRYAVMAEELAQTKAELKHLKEEPRTQRGLDFAKIIRESFQEAELFRRKSTVAVIEKLAEGANDTETTANDRRIIEKIAKSAGLEGELLPDEIHRHGRKIEKPRILKVPFKSQQARDNFLRGFGNVMRADGSYQRGLRTRRDMVPSELNELYQLRRDAYTKNQECGFFKFFVVDLRIVEAKEPKKLLTANK